MSKRSDPTAILALTLMSDWGLGAPADTTEYRQRWQDAGSAVQRLAVSSLRKCADSGNVGARMLLGMAYYSGTGVVRDVNVAGEYFDSDKKSSERSAIAIIGSGAIAHTAGRHEAGDALLESLMSRPIGFGEYSVGAAFYLGIIFTKDYVQAAKWLRRAAEKGDPRAQGTLGYMYAIGRGVEKDEREAQYWLQQQASNPMRIDEQPKPIVEGYWTSETVRENSRSQ
jgi:TPR repeat protein